MLRSSTVILALLGVGFCSDSYRFPTWSGTVGGGPSGNGNNGGYPFVVGGVVGDGPSGNGNNGGKTFSGIIPGNGNGTPANRTIIIVRNGQRIRINCASCYLCCYGKNPSVQVINGDGSGGHNGGIQAPGPVPRVDNSYITFPGQQQPPTNPGGSGGPGGPGGPGGNHGTDPIPPADNFYRTPWSQPPQPPNPIPRGPGSSGPGGPAPPQGPSVPYPGAYEIAPQNTYRTAPPCIPATTTTTTTTTTQAPTTTTTTTQRPPCYTPPTPAPTIPTQPTDSYRISTTTIGYATTPPTYPTAPPTTTTTGYPTAPPTVSLDQYKVFPDTTPQPWWPSTEVPSTPGTLVQTPGPNGECCYIDLRSIQAVLSCGVALRTGCCSQTCSQSSQVQRQIQINFQLLARYFGQIPARIACSEAVKIGLVLSSEVDGVCKTAPAPWEPQPTTQRPDITIPSDTYSIPPNFPTTQNPVAPTAGPDAYPFPKNAPSKSGSASFSIVTSFLTIVLATVLCL